jgi:hypothetical protein
LIERGMDADPKPRRRRGSRVLSAALIAAAMIAAAYLLAPQTLGEQARRSLLQTLQAHYAGIDISIGSGRFSSDVGLILEDLQFDVAAVDGRPRRPLLRIHRLIVESDFDAQKVIDRKLPFIAKRMIAVGVEMDAWPDADGQWSLARLWPPPKMGPGCPRFQIHDGRLRLHRDSHPDNPAQNRPVELDHLEVSVDVAPATSTSPAIHRVMAKARSDFANHLLIEGSISSTSTDLRGALKDFRIDPVLTSRMPLIPQASQQHLRGLTIAGDVSFAIRKLKDRPLNYFAKWNCHDGRYAHEALPQPIEKILGIVTMTPQGAVIESGQAHLGDAVCRISGETKGWGQEADIAVRLIASNFMLNDRIAASLPDVLKQPLDRVRPRGLIDIDSRVQRTAGKWNADAVLDLHGLDVSVEVFPYPVSQLIGRVHFRDWQIWSEQLSGRLASQRLNISFHKSLPAAGLASSVRLAADGPIAIDSMLLNSLTPRGEATSKLETFVRTLSPRGSVHLASGEWTTSAAGVKSHSLDLRISGGNLRYSGFPYSLYDVAGQIISRDDTVSLINFRGKNGDNATIHCEGTFEALRRNDLRHALGDWRVGLRFQATNLPLDETIRSALPVGSQQTWDALAPGGILDFIDVQVSHAAAFTTPQLLIAAKQEPRRTVDSRTVNLRPIMLPYRLDIMEGVVSYDGKEVVIESLDARHDSTRLAVDGRCVQAKGGQWRLDLNVRSGSRVHPDSELINALPNQVRGAFQRLQLRGPLSVRGTTSLLLPDALHPDPIIDWGLTLQLEGNRIGDVGPVHDIRGEIMVNGKRDGSAVMANGVVSIDSMHVDDKQVTAIHGPFAVRDDRLLLGETIAVINADETGIEPSQPIAPIEGRLFGGIASLSGDVLLSNGNFDVTMAIREGDVATLLADLGETHSTVVGKFDGRIKLEGTVGASHLLKGNGSGKLANANLYQLPILVQVFNMLRVKPSEAVAFTDGEVRFSIYGDNVSFNQMQLWGDLIALHGSGTLNRTKEVDLTFNSRVSPQNGWSQITRPFGDNQYTLWTISVKGPLADPTIERISLSAVNETLERLFPGIAMPARRSGPISTQIGNLRDRVLK